MSRPGAKMNLSQATMLVAGHMIGTGVFLLPVNLAHVGGIAIFGWIVATAGVAALSGDGRYVAHVVISERGQGLWLRQVATSSNVEIVPPGAVRFTGLAFSPDGNYVLYIIYPQGQNFASMFQVPVLGGATRQLVYDIDSAPAFSPDGARFAFVRGGPTETAIMLANADGGGVRELAKRAETQPELKPFVDFIGESTRSLVR